jgi:DNA repair protein RadA/Sms
MEEKTGETVFYKTGFAGLDAMLGGGLARGMAYFIYGRPGIGKTTLLLQVLSAIQGGTDENSIYL